MLRKSIIAQQNREIYYLISSAEEFKLLNSQERKKKKNLKPQLLNLFHIQYSGGVILLGATISEKIYWGLSIKEP